MSYTLRSLTLRTEFDRPVVPLPVPGRAQMGKGSAVVFADGAGMASGRFARVTRPSALLGLQLDEPIGPLRVSLGFSVDDVSTERWRLARSLEDGEMPNEYGRHRLLELSVQGGAPTGVMLQRRRSDDRVVRQRVSVDVAAEDLGDDGLLTFAVDLPEQPPTWARRGLLEEGTVGVCIDHVRVEPLSGRAVTPYLSTGRPARGNRHPVPRNPGFFLVNPGAGQELLTIHIKPRLRTLPAQERSGGVSRTLARLRSRRTPEEPQRTSEATAEMEIQPIDGGRGSKVTLRPEDDGSYLARIPADGAPAYVRPILSGPEGERRVAWFAWVTEEPSQGTLPPQ